MADLLTLGGVEVPILTAPIGEEGDDSLLADLHREFQPGLLDPVQVALRDARHARRLTPTEKRKARALIRRYCERSIATAVTKHYSQRRPMTHLGESPDAEWTADCSGHVTGAFKWAELFTSFPVEDPNGLNYSGFGYTGTLLSRNFRHRIPEGRTYFIGDMGLYGPAGATRHVVTCFKGGNASTSVWASHGNEAGPYPVRLHYRSDFLCVVRGWSLL